MLAVLALRTQSLQMQGEIDDTAMDVNFSGNLSFDNIMDRYVPDFLQVMPLRLGVLNGETKLSGSLLKPYDLFTYFIFARYLLFTYPVRFC